jgi:hypothetical protein
MARRRQKDGGAAELLFSAVGYAWRSPPHKVALMGAGVALVFCGAVPALLGLAMPAPSPATSLSNMATGAIAPLVALFSKFSTWAGIGGAALCFGCAALNLVRGNGDKGRSKEELRQEPTGGAGQGGPVTASTKAAPVIPFIRKSLLTPTELIFFKRLREAFSDVLICPQLALAAVVDIPARYNQNQYKYANRAPFAAKYADFAIVEPDTGDVLAIVELDDYSHDGAERQAEDAARDAMLDEVGIPVHRFDARKMPTVTELRTLFEEP